MLSVSIDSKRVTEPSKMLFTRITIMHKRTFQVLQPLLTASQMNLAYRYQTFQAIMPGLTVQRQCCRRLIHVSKTRLPSQIGADGAWKLDETTQVDINLPRVVTPVAVLDKHGNSEKGFLATHHAVDTSSLKIASVPKPKDLATKSERLANRVAILEHRMRNDMTIERFRLDRQIREVLEATAKAEKRRSELDRTLSMYVEEAHRCNFDENMEWIRTLFREGPKTYCPSLEGARAEDVLQERFPATTKIIEARTVFKLEDGEIRVLNPHRAWLYLDL